MIRYCLIGTHIHLTVTHALDMPKKKIEFDRHIFIITPKCHYGYKPYIYRGATGTFPYRFFLHIINRFLST